MSVKHTKYTYVILQNVYFQKNVFKLIKNNKPYVTSENKKINTCDTKYNMDQYLL